jgi:MoaA/NifB/PqqE/SkfB family radical SAM enzyme
MPKTANYYVTFRSNDTCEFHTIWQNEEYQKVGEADYQEPLKQLKRQGVKRLNITGGEPLLRDGLPNILKQAKTLGFETQLSTNGILYADLANLIKGAVDRLFFALDYPFASEHDRSRGVECFKTAVTALEQARDLGQRPIIKFTMTRDSVRFLPEMVDLAYRLRVPVYLSPVYDHFGLQGFEPITIEHILYYSRRNHVLVNRAALEFVKRGGNNLVFPRCRAQGTTVTILPDGRQVSPCFFNQAGRQGQAAVCASCMRWPYMLPSFTKGFDRYYWLNLWSEMSQRRKLS